MDHYTLTAADTVSVTELSDHFNLHLELVFILPSY